MKYHYKFLLLLAFSACASAETNRRVIVDFSAFCILPGGMAEQLVTRCENAVLSEENTEEGPLPTYEISHGKYRYSAEIYSGKVDLVRFKVNPIPLTNIAIGDPFIKVRLECGDCEVLMGEDENGYIALHDLRNGVYFSFDTSSVSSDVYSRKDLDESKIADIRLLSVNFLEPK